MKIEYYTYGDKFNDKNEFFDFLCDKDKIYQEGNLIVPSMSMAAEEIIEEVESIAKNIEAISSKIINRNFNVLKVIYSFDCIWVSLDGVDIFKCPYYWYKHRGNLTNIIEVHKKLRMFNDFLKILLGEK